MSVPQVYVIAHNFMYFRGCTELSQNLWDFLALLILSDIYGLFFYYTHGKTSHKLPETEAQMGSPSLASANRVMDTGGNSRVCCKNYLASSSGPTF